jgi:hypothetical protein
MLRGRRRITGAFVVQLILVTVLIGVATVVVLEWPGSGDADAARAAEVAGRAAHPGMNPQDMNDMNMDASTAYYGISRTAKLIVQVDVTPAVVGDNTMLLTVLDSDEAPQKVLKWTATVSPGAQSSQSPLNSQGPQSVQGTPLQVLPLTDNIARAYLHAPSAGAWLLRVTVSTAGGGETTVSQTMKIG